MSDKQARELEDCCQRKRMEVKVIVHASISLTVAALLTTALQLIALPRAARADDKELLVGGGCEGPNVFALMDVSGTMKKWVQKRPAWSSLLTVRWEGTAFRIELPRQRLPMIEASDSKE